MTTQSNKKSWLVYLLALTALVVWGYNGYHFILGIRQSDDPGLPSVSTWQPASTSGDSMQSAALFVYQANHRDPFQEWLSPPKKKIVPRQPVNKKAVKKAEIPRPQIRLIGILRDAAGPLAVLQTENRQTCFCHEQDKIDGVTLVKIDSNWVECWFGKERFRIGLER